MDRRFLPGLLLLLLLRAALAAAPARAQEPDGAASLAGVVAAEDGAPIEGAMVVLLDATGRSRARVLTDAAGRYRFPLPPRGLYRLRVDRIGFASATSEPVAVDGASSVELRVVARVEPVRLAGLEIGGDKRCDVRPTEGRATAVAWEEARKALDASLWTSERGLYRFAWMKYSRRLDANGLQVLRDDRSFSRSFSAHPFVALDPERLVSRGFAETPRGGSWSYAAPDAAVLLSSAFLDTHCFRLRAGTRERAGQLGLEFEPIGDRRVVEIVGTLWLDASDAQLRDLEYRYVNMPAGLRDDRVGGDVAFTGLPNGTWIVREWRIRMPRGSLVIDERGRTSARIIGFQEDGGLVSEARSAGGQIAFHRGEGGVVGEVRDSLGVAAPRVWVRVQGSELSALTDSAGSFALPSLGRGTWTLTTGTPELEMVGRVVRRDVEITRDETIRVRIDLPSVREAAIARCRATPPEPGEAVLVGQVVDSAGTPVSGATVHATWTDFAFRAHPGTLFSPSPLAADAGETFEEQIARGVRMSDSLLGLLTDEEGRFRFCGVPSYHTVHVRVSDGVRGGRAELWLPTGTELSVARIVVRNGVVP